MSNGTGFSFLRSACNSFVAKHRLKADLTCVTQWVSTGNFQIPASLGHLELRRLWRCHSVLKHGLTAVFTVPQDWTGHSKNAMACLALFPHHHFDLNQLRIYKSALRSAGSFLLIIIITFLAFTLYFSPVDHRRLHQSRQQSLLPFISSRENEGQGR